MFTPSYRPNLPVVTVVVVLQDTEVSATSFQIASSANFHFHIIRCRFVYTPPFYHSIEDWLRTDPIIRFVLQDAEQQLSFRSTFYYSDSQIFRHSAQTIKLAEFLRLAWTCAIFKRSNATFESPLPRVFSFHPQNMHSRLFELFAVTYINAMSSLLFVAKLRLCDINWS